MTHALLLLALSIPLVARGQNAPTGIFVDAVVGAGPRTQHAGNVWFRPETTPYGRVTLGTAIPFRGRLAGLLTFDRAGAIQPPAYGDVCRLAPDGSCERYFNWLAVYSAGAGLRGRVGRATELELVGGVGVTHQPSRFVRVVAEWRLASHLALIGGGEHRTARRDDGARLWWRPLFGGLRLQ